MDDNNWHTCANCSGPVHDYGPDADATNVRGRWFHLSCWYADDDSNEPEVSPEDPRWSALVSRVRRIVSRRVK